MAKLKVKVTKKHIAEGQQGDANSCAIALAVKDAVAAQYKKCDVLGLVKVENLDINVDGQSITVDGNDLGFTKKELVEKFVEAFDDAGDEPQSDDYHDEELFKAALADYNKQQKLVKPFEFTLG